MIKLSDIILEKKSNKEFGHEDRIKMYKEYYKNLSPKNFKVKIKKNTIQIIIPE